MSGNLDCLQPAYVVTCCKIISDVCLEEIVCGAEQIFNDYSSKISRLGEYYWSRIHGIIIHLNNIILYFYLI